MKGVTFFAPVLVLLGSVVVDAFLLPQQHHATIAASAMATKLDMAKVPDDEKKVIWGSAAAAAAGWTLASQVAMASVMPPAEMHPTQGSYL